MVKWSCGSSLCFNNFSTDLEKKTNLRAYGLPSDESMQRKYQAFFKTTGFNWERGHICNEHWSSEKDQYDMPDIILTKKMYETIKDKYEKARKRFTGAKKPTKAQRDRYINAKKKYQTASSIFSSTSSSILTTRKVKDHKENQEQSFHHPHHQLLRNPCRRQQHSIIIISIVVLLSWGFRERTINRKNQKFRKSAEGQKWKAE